MGYSDLGCFGGEVESPNLDALAASVGKGVSAEQLITQMSAAVDAFVGDAEQSDDLTMLALRILPGRKSAKK